MELNLPTFKHRIRKANDELDIYDIIRKKYVRLTPEEWVRQHLVHHLINFYKYPKSLIRVEKGLIYNERIKRADIVIFDQKGAPFLIVECKAASIPVAESTLFQAAVYNKTIGAKYLMISNGMAHLCCKYVAHEVMAMCEIPKFK